MKKKKPITASELGILGGSATFKKYGKKHYVKMAMARYNPEKYALKYGAKK